MECSLINLFTALNSDSLNPPNQSGWAGTEDEGNFSQILDSLSRAGARGAQTGEGAFVDTESAAGQFEVPSDSANRELINILLALEGSCDCLDAEEAGGPGELEEAGQSLSPDKYQQEGKVSLKILSRLTAEVKAYVKEVFGRNDGAGSETITIPEIISARGERLLAASGSTADQFSSSEALETQSVSDEPAGRRSNDDANVRVAIAVLLLGVLSRAAVENQPDNFEENPKMSTVDGESLDASASTAIDPQTSAVSNSVILTGVLPFWQQVPIVVASNNDGQGIADDSASQAQGARSGRSGVQCASREYDPSQTTASVFAGGETGNTDPVARSRDFLNDLIATLQRTSENESGTKDGKAASNEIAEGPQSKGNLVVLKISTGSSQGGNPQSAPQVVGKKDVSELPVANGEATTEAEIAALLDTKSKSESAPGSSNGTTESPAKTGNQGFTQANPMSSGMDHRHAARSGRTISSQNQSGKGVDPAINTTSVVTSGTGPGKQGMPDVSTSGDKELKILVEEQHGITSMNAEGSDSRSEQQSMGQFEQSVLDRSGNGQKAANGHTVSTAAVDRFEKAIMQAADRAGGQDLTVKLDVGNDETVIVALKDLGQTISVEVKASHQSLINILQSQKEAIIRQLEGKDLRTSIYIDPNASGNPERRERRENRQGRFVLPTARGESFDSLLEVLV